MRSVVATILFLVITIVLSIISLPFAVIDRSGKSYLWFARLWAKIFLVLLGTGVGLGALSSYLAVRRYLRA